MAACGGFGIVHAADRVKQVMQFGHTPVALGGKHWGGTGFLGCQLYFLGLCHRSIVLGSSGILSGTSSRFAFAVMLTGCIQSKPFTGG